MKKLMLGLAMLMSAAVMHTEIEVHMDVELKEGDDHAREVVVDCILEPSETVHITTQDLEVALVAEPQGDDMVELTCTIIKKNEDDTYTIIAEPVVCAEYGKEAEVRITEARIEDGNETALSLKVTAHQHNAEDIE